MSALDVIICIPAAVIVIPLALIPFFVEAGEKDGIVKTGRHGDDR